MLGDTVWRTLTGTGLRKVAIGVREGLMASKSSNELKLDLKTTEKLYGLCCYIFDLCVLLFEFVL